MEKKDCKIELCETCGCFVFQGQTMTCANGHDIDISKLTRKEVIPFYQMLIENHFNELESEIVKSFNSKIMSKWKPSALIYIKDMAWKNIAKNKTTYPLVFNI